jgi:hypothetical protein
MGNRAYGACGYETNQLLDRYVSMNQRITLLRYLTLSLSSDRFAAMNAITYDFHRPAPDHPSRACGMCAQLWCPSGSECEGKSTIIHMVDRCPGCSWPNKAPYQDSSIDISHVAYEDLLGSWEAVEHKGLMAVNWKFVECPPRGSWGAVSAPQQEPQQQQQQQQQQQEENEASSTPSAAVATATSAASNSTSTAASTAAISPVPTEANQPSMVAASGKNEQAVPQFLNAGLKSSVDSNATAGVFVNPLGSGAEKKPLTLGVVIGAAMMMGWLMGVMAM